MQFSRKNAKTQRGGQGPGNPSFKPDLQNGKSDSADFPSGEIRPGLLAVAGLSPELVTRILDERDRHGPYRTPEDFWSRARPTPDEAQRLILCGAMDAFALPRVRLMMQHALWSRAQTHDSPLAPWDGSLPEWAREERCAPSTPSSSAAPPEWAREQPPPPEPAAAIAGTAAAETQR